MAEVNLTALLNHHRDCVLRESQSAQHAMLAKSFGEDAVSSSTLPAVVELEASILSVRDQSDTSGDLVGPLQYQAGIGLSTQSISHYRVLVTFRGNGHDANTRWHKISRLRRYSSRMHSLSWEE